MFGIMLPWASAVVVIFACALLNRVRGGGLYGDRLPGRALYWVAPAVGALVLLVSPWPVALAWAVGYLVWGLPGWGFTLSRLGGYAPDREPEGLDAALGRLPTLLAVAVRMMLVMPAVAAVAWLIGDWRFLAAGPAFAAAATTIYAILFRPIGSHDWMRAELAVGVLWGALILVAAAF